MTPLATSSVLPVSLGSPAETGLLTPSVVSPIPPPGQQSSTTPTPVVPVVPDDSTPPSEPVNPVITGNQAGLPPTDTEGVMDGITPKTFKLPTSVMQSLQRAVDRLNEVTPGNTTHSYGVSLLSRHEELMRYEQEAQQYKALYERYKVLYENTEIQYKDVTAQYAQARDHYEMVLRGLQDSAKPGSTPLPTSQPEPVMPPVEDAWRLRYLDIQQELEKALEAHSIDKKAVQPLYSLFKVLPELLEQLYLEAEKNSWNSAAYYQHFFQELLAPYVETK